jgi:hypothetical protein
MSTAEERHREEIATLMRNAESEFAAMERTIDQWKTRAFEAEESLASSRRHEHTLLMRLEEETKGKPVAEEYEYQRALRFAKIQGDLRRENKELKKELALVREAVKRAAKVAFTDRSKK